jgi:excinuclease ABC subunit C
MSNFVRMTTKYIEHIKLEILPTLPEEPGIYKYFDANDKIIYIGKAKNLKRRVSSYFNRQQQDSGKTRLLVQNIVRIEFTVVETEQDALLLENVLIKKYQPKYNIMLKDDKTYPYICIKKERFPRVFLTRQVERDGSEYFGPYAQVGVAYTILELIQRLFPLRNCNFNLSAENIGAQKFKSCLEYQVGNCKAPCIAAQSEADYNDSIAQIRHILRGNVSSAIQYLKELMRQFSEQFAFEQAQVVKEKLVHLQNYQSKSTVVNPKINNVEVYFIENTEKRAFVSYLKVVNGAIIQTKVIELGKQLEESVEDLLIFGMTELRQQLDSRAEEAIVPIAITYPDPNLRISVPQIGDKKKLLELAQKNAFYYRKQYEIQTTERKTGADRQFEILSQLKKDLRLQEVPQHIECFDNSNIQGAFPVASMVVFKNGKAAKKEYRHFNIKTVSGPNDFASMEEIVLRRYKRLLAEAQTLPQLILIDGGKGQLSAAVKSLKELGVYGKVAVAGIAKRLEEIYLPDDPVPLHIDKKSESLRLIQQVRNEAHRFAITFHRQKRSKGTFLSELQKIKGIGDKSIEKLFQHFKSIDVIRTASAQQLQEVLTAKQADLIIAYFAQ